MGQVRVVERRLTIIDTSVLINFLTLGRLDLMKLPHRQMLITGEVRTEIIRNRAGLETALASGQIEVTNPILEDEIELFARLTKRLSIADASCIVAARVLDADLATDDRAFRHEAALVLPEVRLLHTESLLAEGVREKLLLLEEGNLILQSLIRIRYRPSITNLQELLGNDFVS